MEKQQQQQQPIGCRIGAGRVVWQDDRTFYPPEPITLAGCFVLETCSIRWEQWKL